MTNTNTNTQVTTTAKNELSAKEIKLQTYAAYLAYVKFIEGGASIVETVEALAPIMAAYEYTLTVDNLANTLTVRMTSYGKDKGEIARKVKSISTFRAFVKGGWADVEKAPVHSNAGKEPVQAKEKAAKAAKVKKPTKADLEKELKELKEKMAAAEALQVTQVTEATPANITEFPSNRPLHIPAHEPLINDNGVAQINLTLPSVFPN